MAKLSAARFPDLSTLISISALAYLLETGLHEHLGHTLACVVLGGSATEMGAFYVACDYTGMGDLPIRLVAVAGPLMSLLTGLLCFFSLRRIPPGRPALYYFTWLLSTLGLMTATGYLLFSGVLGLGDFGTSRDGALYQVSDAWVWRILMVLAGAAGYYAIIRLAVREIDPHIAGSGRPRIGFARKLTLVSYLTGAVLSIAIGFLNPQGIIIVLMSSASESLGGTSGFLWMNSLLRHDAVVPEPGLTFGRLWGWIVLGVGFTLIYALVLGPTLFF